MGLQGLQVARRGATVAAFAQLVADLLVVREPGHPGALYRGNMDEHVLAAIIGGNESVSLRGVEPFNGAGRHAASPSKSPPASLLSGRHLGLRYVKA